MITARYLVPVTDSMGAALPPARRTIHRLGDLGLLKALLIALNDQQPATKRRLGTTVGHEDLRWTVDLDQPHPNRRFSPHQANPPATNFVSR